jgi:hypothetical protein
VEGIVVVLEVRDDDPTVQTTVSQISLAVLAAAVAAVAAAAVDQIGGPCDLVDLTNPIAPVLLLDQWPLDLQDWEVLEARADSLALVALVGLKGPIDPVI